MKRKIIIITVIIFITIIFLALSGRKANLLVNPSLNSSQQVISPSPIPVSSPKTFRFDSTTDLEAELEKVNPEVYDSDFE